MSAKTVNPLSAPVRTPMFGPNGELSREWQRYYDSTARATASLDTGAYIARTRGDRPGDDGAALQKAINEWLPSEPSGTLILPFGQWNVSTPIVISPTTNKAQNWRIRSEGCQIISKIGTITQTVTAIGAGYINSAYMRVGFAVPHGVPDYSQALFTGVPHIPDGVYWTRASNAYNIEIPSVAYVAGTPAGTIKYTPSLLKIVASTNVRNLDILDLSFVGSGTEVTGAMIELVGGDGGAPNYNSLYRCTIKNCRAESFNYHGIWAYNQFFESSISDCYMDGQKFIGGVLVNAKGSGYHIESGPFSGFGDLKLDRCFAYNCQIGIDVEQVGEVDASHCMANQCTAQGIYLSNNFGTTVLNNHVENNWLGAVPGGSVGAGLIVVGSGVLIGNRGAALASVGSNQTRVIFCYAGEQTSIQIFGGVGLEDIKIYAELHASRPQSVTRCDATNPANIVMTGLAPGLPAYGPLGPLQVSGVQGTNIVVNGSFYYLNVDPNQIHLFTAWAPIVGNLTIGATSMTLGSVSGTLPAAPFTMLIESELVRVIALAGSVATITRAYGGTTAAIHASGTGALVPLDATGQTATAGTGTFGVGGDVYIDGHDDWYAPYGSIIRTGGHGRWSAPILNTGLNFFNAAPTLIPDPSIGAISFMGTLTSDVAVRIPSTMVKDGDSLGFIFQQPSTGSTYKVTFDPQFYDIGEWVMPSTNGAIVALMFYVGGGRGKLLGATPQKSINLKGGEIYTFGGDSAALAHPSFLQVQFDSTFNPAITFQRWSGAGAAYFAVRLEVGAGAGGSITVSMAPAAAIGAQVFSVVAQIDPSGLVTLTSQLTAATLDAAAISNALGTAIRNWLNANAGIAAAITGSLGYSPARAGATATGTTNLTTGATSVTQV